VHEHLLQREIQKIGQSVRTPVSSDSNTPNITTAVHQIITELSKPDSEKAKFGNYKIITYLTEAKWLLDFTGVKNS
jgi:hypothetical protein